METLRKSTLHNGLPDLQGGDQNGFYHLDYNEYLNVQNLISGGTGTSFLSDDGTYKPISSGSQNDTIQIQILSEGNQISDGFKGYKYVNNDITIEKAILSANDISTIDFSIKISGSTIGTIALSGESYKEDSLLIGWTTNVLPNTFLEFYIDNPGFCDSNMMVVILILEIKIN
jgi:hypothetical protein